MSMNRASKQAGHRQVRATDDVPGYDGFVCLQNRDILHPYSLQQQVFERPAIKLRGRDVE